jgi:hypothetical protein
MMRAKGQAWEYDVEDIELGVAFPVRLYDRKRNRVIPPEGDELAARRQLPGGDFGDIEVVGDGKIPPVLQFDGDAVFRVQIHRAAVQRPADERRRQRWAALVGRFFVVEDALEEEVQ